MSLQSELNKHNLRLINLYKSTDFSPLKYIDAKILRYFTDDYACVQPNECTQLILYKLDCFSTKNFYTPNKKLSDHLNKKYSKDKDVNYKTVTVLECFRLFFAELNININKFESLKCLKAKQFCCYIPSEYLDDLLQSQFGLPCVRLQFIQNGLFNQKSFFDKYIQKTNELNEKYLEKYFTLKRAIKLANKGVYNDNIPSELRNILIHLRKSQSVRSVQYLPDKTYELNSVELCLPDGRQMRFFLTCRLNYDGFFVNKLKKKNKEFEEKTHKYSLIFNWI